MYRGQRQSHAAGQHATSAPELLTLDVNKLENKYNSHVPWTWKECKECWLVLHSAGAFPKHLAWNTDMHTHIQHITQSMQDTSRKMFEKRNKSNVANIQQTVTFRSSVRHAYELNSVSVIFQIKC